MKIKVKVTRYADRRHWVMYYDCPRSNKRITRSTGQTTKTEANKSAGNWEAQLNEGGTSRDPR